MSEFFSDAESYYEELWDEIRQFGASTPSPPAIQPVQPEPLMRPSLLRAEFGHALRGNAEEQDSEEEEVSTVSFLTSEVHVVPIATPPLSPRPAAAAAAQPALPPLPDASDATINSIYTGRLRPGVFRLPSSLPTSSSNNQSLSNGEVQVITTTTTQRRSVLPRSFWLQFIRDEPRFLWHEQQYESGYI
ncbi:hypothetical protein SMACR_06151 [Sordaria macrospora]|uniref:WGS project CABT00000000 data, contig 2.33 n=2 Tax=Sordaria macrospora TaxID=5147 RepID=F7W669_SORMK|nr:uncharacterized protein SMAC_06151 [Sordaria macrospora k-hell]KAA8628015.1 hypothetical protein SMACR_06151 [Sordaria macrospora]WPJ66991.1 hypothetical protein SMAC4_06151 [Sordaria macrospora]CCC13007.1 unnamed protein product [Sordaria macrospora k-hell]